MWQSVPGGWVHSRCRGGGVVQTCESRVPGDGFIPAVGEEGWFRHVRVGSRGMGSFPL